MNLAEMISHAATAAKNGVVSAALKAATASGPDKKSHAIEFAESALDAVIPAQFRPLVSALIPPLVELALAELKSHHVFG